MVAKSVRQYVISRLSASVGICINAFGKSDAKFAGECSLSLSLLKHVRQFVEGYESARCPLWLWEEAILQGYAAFRFLRKERRGLLKLDLVPHVLHL
jgi:hypothetical protein